MESTAPLLLAWTSAAHLISHVLNIYYFFDYLSVLFCFVWVWFGLVLVLSIRGVRGDWRRCSFLPLRICRHPWEVSEDDSLLTTFLFV